MREAPATFDTIPIVDVSAMWGTADERSELAAELTRICHEIGFFVITGHGIEQSLIDEVFASMAKFFALDDERKAIIDKVTSPHFRGWESVGSEFTNNRVDVREQIDLWSEWEAEPGRTGPAYERLLGPNQWLPDHVVPGHRELTLDWMHRLGELADQILETLAIGLGLDATLLRTFFGDRPMSLVKMINYPPTPAGGAGVNAHHDTGFLTLLSPGPVAGLQVRTPLGDWVEVSPPQGTFVVNLGEMLQAMTGNYFVATAHRVVAAEQRLSTAYFHGPSLDAELHPLELDERFAAAVARSERHAAAGFMASAAETDAGVDDMSSPHRAATYGAQLWNYFARSYPTNMALHHSDIVGADTVS